MENKGKAFLAVQGIVGDITDRKGIGNEFDLMELDIKDEMLEHWKEIIMSQFDKGENHLLEALNLLHPKRSVWRTPTEEEADFIERAMNKAEGHELTP